MAHRSLTVLHQFEASIQRMAVVEHRRRILGAELRVRQSMTGHAVRRDVKEVVGTDHAGRDRILDAFRLVRSRFVGALHALTVIVVDVNPVRRGTVATLARGSGARPRLIARVFLLHGIMAERAGVRPLHAPVADGLQDVLGLMLLVHRLVRFIVLGAFPDLGFGLMTLRALLGSDIKTRPCRPRPACDTEHESGDNGGPERDPQLVNLTLVHDTP